MRLLIGLALASGVAHAGVVYDLVNRSLVAPSSAPVVAHYVIQDDKVRVAATDGRLVFIFKDQTIYIIDNTLRSVSAQRYATLDQVAAKAISAQKKLQDAAASAPPAQRAMLVDAARQMQELNDHQFRAVPRDYLKTDRSDAVDGHRCRIWEERENSTKRLELCVVPANSMRGGAELLHGMRTLSQYWRGSTFALGVEFVPTQWWSGIDSLGGLPILVREFKDGKAISETTITRIHVDVPGVALFDLPAGYPVQEQPLGDP